jgi:ABC-2 type transport system permease protein
MAAMWKKIWIITRKELWMTFRDTSLLALMFAAPLALATIIGATFGGAGSGSSPISNIPVALVNLDAGADADAFAEFGAQEGGGQLGEIYADVLLRPAGAVPEGPPDEIWELMNVTLVSDADSARSRVDSGTFTAAIIIPADFTASVSPMNATGTVAGVSVEVYANPDSPISASIVRSVVESITNQIATGNIAIASLIQTMIDQQRFTQILSITNSPAFQDAAGEIFGGRGQLVQLERQDAEGEQVVINPFVFIGSAQALFFAMFTASGGAISVIEERRNYTLQRLLMTPTTRMTILLGKMMGTFATVLVQLVFLFIAFTIIASLLAGEVTFIWGTNIPGLLALIVASALAGTGLGTVVAAVAKTPNAAGTIMSVVSILMAALGGAFGFMLEIGPRVLSIVYWGSDGFLKLSVGNNDIGLNVLVLAAFGVVTFFAGLFLFNRRLNE